MFQHPRILVILGVVAACDGNRNDAPDVEADALHDALGQPLSATALAAIEGNEDAEAEAVLLARVEVQPGEVIEFYEPSPGMIVVSGTGRPEGKPLVDAELIETLDIEGLWALVSDADEMPAPLAAAVARAAEGPARPQVSLTAMPDAAPSSVDGFAAEPDVQSAGYCDTGYFDIYEGGCPAGDDWQMCLNNWWNGAWGEHDDAMWGFTSVCPAVGNILYKVYWSNGGGGQWTVNQNYYRWFAGSDWDCEAGWDIDCPTFRVDVTQASGNRFHLRMRVWE